MPDRIIRDELLESTRWLDLPTDTHRLVFIALVTKADDYGNCEGGNRRLFRWMHSFTQIKIEADAVKLMSELQDADLVRRYEVAGKDYWHIPRFKNSRRYWSRKHPQSPYTENTTLPSNQHDTKNTSADLPQTCANPSGGVGVGVGVGVGLERSKEKQTAPRRKQTPLPADFGTSFSPAMQAWLAKRGETQIKAHLIYFIGYAKANGKQYADWEQALQNAIRDDWANVRSIKA